MQINHQNPAIRSAAFPCNSNKFRDHLPLIISGKIRKLYGISSRLSQGKDLNLLILLPGKCGLKQPVRTETGTNRQIAESQQSFNIVGDGFYLRMHAGSLQQFPLHHSRNIIGTAHDKGTVPKRAEIPRLQLYGQFFPVRSKIRKQFPGKNQIDLLLIKFFYTDILLTFILIGILTAAWRSSGTLSAIVCYASTLIRPSVFYLAAFLLNCLVSFLTGTSFGTAATMGSVCASMALAMNSSMVLTGGAILSGAYFGDRCSPVSTSAMLIADLTETRADRNIPLMLKTGLVPFCLTCLLYLAAGLSGTHASASTELISRIAEEFQVHPIMLLPAGVILLLPLLHVSTKTAIFCSILTAVPICLLQQHMPVSELLRSFVLGYRCPAEDLAGIMNGGGIVSMVKAGSIVSISSCCSGIFRETDLLKSFRTAIRKLRAGAGSSLSTMLVSVFVCAVTCNQTLSIMLTHQLCSEIEPSKEEEAIDLENTVAVIAPLIPWSIAAGVPLSSVGAPTTSILYAFFLFLVPLCHVLQKSVHLPGSKFAKEP